MDIKRKKEWRAGHDGGKREEGCPDRKREEGQKARGQEQKRSREGPHGQLVPLRGKVTTPSRYGHLASDTMTS